MSIIKAGEEELRLDYTKSTKRLRQRGSHMITHIDITGVRYSLDDTTKRYVRKKLGRLDKYLPRHARKTAKIEVVLKEVNRAYGNKYECDVNLHIPDALINAKDSTMNMLAAVDIVEAKLKNQLKKYKDEHTDHHAQHNFIGRLKRRVRRPQLEV